MEESFPRGGALVTSSKRKASTPKDRDIFKTTEEEPKVKKKKIISKEDREKHVRAKRKKEIRVISAVRTDVITEPSVLMRKHLGSGMLILGCVREIRDFELVVSLPNGHTGVVPITSICDAYTAALQKLASQEDGQNDEQDLASLAELFHIGQVVRAKIIHVPKKEGTSINKQIKLSINPKVVNQPLSVGVVRSGMVLSVCVSSQEDHGYVLDLGIEGASCFVKTKQAEAYSADYNDGVPLNVGSYLHCLVNNEDKFSITSSETRTITVTIDSRKVHRAIVKDNAEVTMDTLLPGMVVEAIVIKTTDEGLAVKFMSFKGRIHRSHLQQSPSQYEIADKIKACVLHVDPTLKIVTLTQLGHLVTPDLAPKRPFGEFAVGDTVEEATVWQIDKLLGVFFWLGSGIRAQAQNRDISDKDVKKIFKKGEKHRCRIIGFDYVDLVVLVSLKESVLNQQFLSVTDIKVGDLVECKIRKFNDRGVTVQVSGHIMGYIPSIHLADVPLRHPEKKFQFDEQLKCKVLSVDGRKVFLTQKKSLVSSKYPTLLHYNQCVPGLVTEGVIYKILEHGLVIRFFGDVQGYVPRKEMSTEEILYPDKVFYLGQVVRCAIKSWYSQDRRLILTLKFAGKVPFGVKEIPVPDDFQIGRIVDCKVRNKTSTGLEVTLLSSKMAAFLPTMHLSDHHNNCSLLLDMYTKGDVIKNAMYYDISNTIVLTKKTCMITSYQNDSVVKTFQDLQPGLLVPGVVKKTMDYGVFVTLGPKLTGLCPNRYVFDKRLDEPSQLYKEGDTVIAKIVEVENEKQRFLLSLRMSDCYHGDIDEGLDLLDSFLTEHHQIMASLKHKRGLDKKIGQFTVGQIVTVVVTSVTEQGVLCCHRKEVKGFVTLDNMPGVTCTEGEVVEAVVLHVDPDAKCLELSLNKELCKSIKHRADNKYSQVLTKQKLKSEVHLVKEHFVLVSLKGHGQGRLAYLPSRKHPNDVLEKHMFAVGQTNPVVVRRIFDDYIMGCLESDLDEAQSSSLPTDDDKFKEIAIKEGDVTTAKIISIHDLQLNILVGGVKGRVHITEITDTPTEGESPLAPFTLGAKIKVKVIGFREFKKDKPGKPAYLPISRAKTFKMLAECTMKMSKVSKKTGYSVDKTDIKAGQTLQGYVIGRSSSYIFMSISSLHKGRVHLVNASKTTPVDVSSFKYGCYYKTLVLNAEDKLWLELSLLDEPWKMTADSKTMGIIKSIHPFQGLFVQLAEKLIGRVALVDISDKYTDQPLEQFKVNQCVKCFILRCTPLHRPHCVLSLRKSRTRKKFPAVTDFEVNEITDLNEGAVMRGYIQNSNDKGIFISLGRSLTGRVGYHMESKYNVTSPKDVFIPGKLVSVKIVSVDTESEHIHLSLLEEDTGEPDIVPPEYRAGIRVVNEPKMEPKGRKRQMSETQKESIKRRRDETTDSGVDSESDTEPQQVSQKSSAKPLRLSLSTDFSWDNTTYKLPVTSSVKAGSDSDSDEEEVEQSSKVKKTRQEKKVEQKLEEQMLFERERLLMSGEQSPETASEFDRLLLQSPDSSIVWLRYMAFHLETAEIDKSRAVAERALKTISFREEQEKLNVWVAYLNLENMYGTTDSLKALFQRALQHNDQLQIYTQLIQIYTRSEQIKAAEDLHRNLIRRFSTDKDVWIRCGAFYFEQNEAESARKLMQRSLKSVPEKQHVEVIAKFAQLEFKHGEAERGKTIFESILSSYPKRTDLWSVYIDMVTRLADLDPVRQLYERVISMNLSTKKMRFFFKKYLSFEEKHGTEETVDVVKKKALDYVENAAQTAQKS